MTDEGSQAASQDPVAALRSAIRDGTSADLAAWTATGVPGLNMLREVLTDRLDLDLRGVHAKDEIDGLRTAVAAIAYAHAAAFLDVFADPDFDTNSYVITGLGYANDPRSTDRLATAARSGDKWLRMEAAIGLAGHNSATAVQTLIELLANSEYLVRYHALRGLVAIGDTTAEAALRGFRGASKIERDLADSAQESIANRGGKRPGSVPMPPIMLSD